MTVQRDLLPEVDISENQREKLFSLTKSVAYANDPSDYQLAYLIDQRLNKGIKDVYNLFVRNVIYAGREPDPST